MLFLKEYDDLQERKLMEQMSQEAKFNDSREHDIDLNKSADEVIVGRDSSPQKKATQYAAQNKKLSDSPLP